MRTFAPTLECRDVTLDSLESLLGAFYVLLVGVPFCCFFCEACVVEILARHCARTGLRY
jgi:hypothetical protein